MDQAIAEALGVALNEASWLSCDVDTEAAIVDLGFAVLTLPDVGPMPEDRRRTLRLTGVARIVSSYRDGRWDDPDVAATPIAPSELTRLIQNFGELPVYGWEFIDQGDGQFRQWRSRLSFDVSLAGRGDHTIDVFQEDGRRILDFRCWFADVEILDSSGARIAVEEFAAGGSRWWTAMYAGDPRASGEGIVPGAP